MKKLQKKKIGTFRPKIGICASKYFKVLGKFAKYDLVPSQPLNWKDLKNKL